MQYYTFLEFVEKVNVWIITNLEDGYRSRPLIDIMTISYCKDLSARLRGSDDEKCVFDIVINKSGNEIFFRVRDDGSGFFGERCFVMIHDSFSGWKSKECSLSNHPHPTEIPEKHYSKKDFIRYAKSLEGVQKKFAEGYLWEDDTWEDNVWTS